MIDLDKECCECAALVGGDLDRIKAAFTYGVACGRLRQVQEELAKVDRHTELVNRSQEENA